jgi:hypothetical protein
MGTAQVLGTIGGGLAVAVGATFAARKFAEPVREHITRSRQEDWMATRDKLKPGDEWTPLPTGYEQPGGDNDFLGAALAPVFGGGVLSVGAVEMSMNHPLLGAGLVAAGAAIIGGTVGTVWAGVHAGRVVGAHYGINIDAQSAEVMRDYDADGDHRIDLHHSGRTIGEYERRSKNAEEGAYGDVYNFDNKGWVSIERFVRSADANHDSTVDEAELRAAFAKFDANHDGIINDKERGDFVGAGNESRALYQVIR